jgi:protein O-mannosyl-transferase
VSTNKPRQPSQKTVTNKPAGKAPVTAGTAIFAVPYPMLWLALAALVVYFPTFFFGFTELDDSIFIREFHAYNEDLRNLITSFQRGVFDALRDPYYRPLFLDSMILNYQISGNGQSIASYHVINVLLHIGNVLLLFSLFRKLGIRQLYAFLLTLIFAVHPVISQAVAWIPGRNDTMLAIFTLPFLLFAIDYANNGRTRELVLSGLFLVLAFFTKETAVFVPPVAFVLIVVVLRRNWQDKRNLVQYGLWAGCFVLWYLVRSTAIVQSNSLAPAQLAADFVHRLPLVVQYTGKIFLPFNLSVFPIQEDTVYYFGISAIAILLALIWLYRERNVRVLLGGLAVFVLFLLPALFVPTSLNEQTFEHRLYLPMTGMLLLLSQTALLHNPLKDKKLLAGGVALAGALAIINWSHQKSFASPLSFWTQAVETSPHSAYANMMLAARLDKDQFEQSCVLFRKAYQLNPNEKYLNFYYGKMLQMKDSVRESEKYLLKEKNTSGYYECDFYLARVAMEKKDLNAAAGYLQAYLKNDPGNKIANTNLLLLYLDTQQPEKAKGQVKFMQQQGMEVPVQILQRLGM